MQTLSVGPSQGTLHLRTGVEGRAARMGHRLTLALTAWECRAEVDGDVPVSVQLRATLPSLQVVKGDGGLKPLSDRDRSTIRDNAMKTLRAHAHPDVVFTSTEVKDLPDGWWLLGDLTLHGVTRPTAVQVSVRPSGSAHLVTATSAVAQTAHGITPYSNMLGALQVSDVVAVRLEALVARH